MAIQNVRAASSSLPAVQDNSQKLIWEQQQQQPQQQPQQQQQHHHHHQQQQQQQQLQQPIYEESQGKQENSNLVCSWKQILLSFNFNAFLGIHLVSLGAFFLGCNRTWLRLCFFNYVIRMFGITAGYHRYFSHRTFKTSRIFQFLLAFIGSSSLQKGVLWWASWHRHHHRHADTQHDAHSPKHSGFWWSHFGWFLFSNEFSHIKWELIPDLAQFPELRWLENFHYLPAAMLALVSYGVGGLGGLTWGFFVSTTLLWHATFCINSIAHMYGSKRFKCEFHTNCDARNNWLLAVLTLGEGWHNNHHAFMGSAKQGFQWYELDISYLLIVILYSVGIIKDIKSPQLDDTKEKLLENSIERLGSCLTT